MARTPSVHMAPTRRSHLPPPSRSLQDVAGLAWSVEAYHPEPARSWPRLQRWAATSHRPGWESTHNAIPSNGSPAATARRKASAVSQWVILSWSTEACRDGGGGVGLEWISDYIQYYSIHHPPSYTAHKPTHATTDSVGSSAVLHFDGNLDVHGMHARPLWLGLGVCVAVGRRACHPAGEVDEQSIMAS